jgi:hypothetical protein
MRGDAETVRRSRAFVGLVTLLALGSVGCAGQSPNTRIQGGTGTGAAGTGTGDVAVRVNSSAEVLTGDEIRATGHGNVWEALRKLRPLWLRARGGTGTVVSPATAPVVYVGGIPFGNPRTLQTMSVDQVRRIEYVDAHDAATRYGRLGGVILVELLDRE